MTDAFILDAVRTPRGRGRPDGSLHSITPIQLAAQALGALRDRTSLDTSQVDDVVLGCVTPVGEQGADIARVAALVAGYAESVPGKQLNRFCASGLESVNTAAAQVMAGQSDWWWVAASSTCRASPWAPTEAPGPTIRRSPGSTISCRRASAPT